MTYLGAEAITMKAAARRLAMLMLLMMGSIFSWAGSSTSAVAVTERAAPTGSKLFVIRNHVFSVTNPSGSHSTARLVLLDGADLLSCFTAPPAFIRSAFPVAMRIATAEGRFACFAGREPLETAALQKAVRPQWAIGRAKPSGNAYSCTAPGGAFQFGDSSSIIRDKSSLAKFWDDPESETFTDDDAQALEYEFWDGFYDADMEDGEGGGLIDEGGGGGAQCMAECNTALATAMRFCNLAPPPIKALCALGAGALYVACIAGC